MYTAASMLLLSKFSSLNSWSIELGRTFLDHIPSQITRLTPTQSHVPMFRWNCLQTCSRMRRCRNSIASLQRYSLCGFFHKILVHLQYVSSLCCGTRPGRAARSTRSRRSSCRLLSRWLCILRFFLGAGSSCFQTLVVRLALSGCKLE